MAVDVVPNTDQALFEVGKQVDTFVEIHPGKNGQPEFYFAGQRLHIVANGWKAEQAVDSYCVLTLSVPARFAPAAEEIEEV